MGVAAVDMDDDGRRGNAERIVVMGDKSSWKKRKCRNEANEKNASGR